MAGEPGARGRRGRAGGGAQWSDLPGPALRLVIQHLAGHEVEVEGLGVPQALYTMGRVCMAWHLEVRDYLMGDTAVSRPKIQWRKDPSGLRGQVSAEAGVALCAEGDGHGSESSKSVGVGPTSFGRENDPDPGTSPQRKWSGPGAPPWRLANTLAAHSSPPTYISLSGDDTSDSEEGPLARSPGVPEPDAVRPTAPSSCGAQVVSGEGGGSDSDDDEVAFGGTPRAEPTEPSGVVGAGQMRTRSPMGGRGFLSGALQCRNTVSDRVTATAAVIAGAWARVVEGRQVVVESPLSVSSEPLFSEDPE